MSKRTYTSIGFIAVLLWALLALFTVGSSPVPPIQLNAMTFAVGGLIGVVWLLATGSVGQLKSVPLHVYVIGTFGLAGYHFLYFSALRMAPAAEAGLIAYLWPLLIVLFSGMLPGEKLRPMHVLGAVMGFAGAATIIVSGATSFDSAALPGYGLAFIAALFWSGYSVISRSFGKVPTASVVVFCLATSILSVPLHLLVEQTIWPADTITWASIALLGIGPVGIAFFVWDVGVKKGDIQLLGVASYAAPVLSTAVLILAGIAAPSWTLLVAAILITSGAALAARASTT
ncbi:EamA family transporter [Marivivens donghaensis]|uniref:EamA family transporter n=1 Tax=Marivivens donghaensis TaxID=1699413 RepID=A0ABX0VZP0_9RHOB|nr:EamA family transporter [Marivivens donghaensis]NIY73551.1 EamA family transporter [Marivivens donghaensis]